MNKLFISSAFALVAMFAFTGNAALAQSPQVNLPSAGLTPESPFYFLDRFGENLRQFFTFNPEAKAKLQIKFAGERIAEIKVILETKGVEAKGLKVAQSRLQAHLANAATIVVDRKAEGKDVSRLAKELDDEFEGPKTALEQAFEAEKRALKVQEEELKIKIRAARQAGDTAQLEILLKQLGEVKAQKKLLEFKEEEQKEALEQEEKRIEEEMEAQKKAEEAIREAEKEKLGVLDEAAEEDVTVPAEAFNKFNSLLAQAKAALAAGNFQEARRLAKQAEKSLDAVEDAVENLKEAREEVEEFEEEQEGKVKEEAEKEREKAEENAREAEERLREAGNEEESD